MRVLGVDPGLTRCGLGIVDSDPRRTLSLVEVGVLRTPPDMPIQQRLLTISAGIEEWIVRHDVEAVAVERVFAQHNVASVMGTAQVAGLAMVAAARAGLPLGMHTPSEVKAAVTGSGRADKPQVQEMVRRILRLAERPEPADAADALALAVCHLWRGGTPGVGPTARHATPAQEAWARAELAARRSRPVTRSR
ncbi:crossover junction endodeoxyribonuclease RuvC [Oceanitalea stevensii]|uniref:Crossover junction endodeoxyribonuclease RuvC n=1 Tax=Oceanitalea stevensii TaxID=2763072 RepID=A0ABR8YYT4_9MICO|nr:crossover junction endodeoxyribonuclease RuvC [Oceanitalea stevensii]MBD8061233.1 crossover junction endodeoxyribonuclease RuvC [Oceanitalea stevensii]